MDGDLFAIVAQKSMDYDFGGAITGFAANMDLVQHYCRAFHAEYIGMLHEYQIFINENLIDRKSVV